MDYRTIYAIVDSYHFLLPTQSQWYLLEAGLLMIQLYFMALNLCGKSDVCEFLEHLLIVAALSHEFYFH